MFEIDGALATDSRLIPPKEPYGLGKNRKVEAWGHISAAQTWVFSEPRLTSARQTQFTYGEGVGIFAQQHDYLQVQSFADAYVGWVHKRAITRNEAPQAQPSYTTRCIAPVTQAPDMKSPIVSALPIDAWVNLSDKEGDYVQIAGLGWVHQNHLQARSNHDAIIVTARAQIGRSYVWGGRGIMGLDCSALSQLCYRFAGLSIPRDADLQRLYLAQHHQAVETKDIAAGDLIYIPGHVMIYIGKGKIIHASGHHMQVVEESFIKALQRYHHQFGDDLELAIYRW